MDWFGLLSGGGPLGLLGGGIAGRVASDAWATAMLALWDAGLWLLRLVLTLMDGLLTPDLGDHGPGAALYAATFWVAGALVVTMLMVQLAVTAVRRDGRSLARVAVGVAQFGLACVGWVGYGVLVVAACGGLTRALMQSLLQVTSWSTWRPWEPLSVDDFVDSTVATVLGVLGLFLLFAAVGHLLVLLTRSASLLVLAATAPISAAGLTSEAGRGWFWKSLRWFHAAAFTPVLMVLVLGVGVQVSSGVADGQADGPSKAIGTALPGVLLILISCVSPLALFKMLAFVDPGTSSGAALRRGLAAHGGLTGLLGKLAPGAPGAPGAASNPGGPSSSPNSAGSSGGSGVATGSAAASRTDRTGRSHGEVAGEAATAGRFAKAAAVLGPAGRVAATAAGFASSVATAGAAVGADLTNQMGVGHHSWHPEPSGPGRRPGAGPPKGSPPTSPHDRNRYPGTGPRETAPPTSPPSPSLSPTGASPTPGASGSVPAAVGQSWTRFGPADPNARAGSHAELARAPVLAPAGQPPVTDPFPL